MGSEIPLNRDCAPSDTQTFLGTTPHLPSLTHNSGATGTDRRMRAGGVSGLVGLVFTARLGCCWAADVNGESAMLFPPPLE